MDKQHPLRKSQRDRPRAAAKDFRRKPHAQRGVATRGGSLLLCQDRDVVLGKGGLKKVLRPLAKGPTAALRTAHAAQIHVDPFETPQEFDLGRFLQCRHIRDRFGLWTEAQRRAGHANTRIARPGRKLPKALEKALRLRAIHAVDVVSKVHGLIAIIAAAVGQGRQAPFPDNLETITRLPGRQVRQCQQDSEDER